MRHRMNLVKQLTQAGLCYFKIIYRLQVEPVLRRLFKSAPKQQCQFSCHWAHPLTMCEIRMGETPIARANSACEMFNSPKVSLRNSPGWIAGSPFFAMIFLLSGNRRSQRRRIVLDGFYEALIVWLEKRLHGLHNRPGSRRANACNLRTAEACAFRGTSC